MIFPFSVHCVINLCQINFNFNYDFSIKCPLSHRSVSDYLFNCTFNVLSELL